MTRSALITGVGRRRGIGAGIAAGLAADGWDLALSYWRPYDERLHLESDPDDPDHLAKELRGLGSKVELLPANLEESSAAETLVHAAVETLGPLDALVMSHCEGVNSGILDTSVESFDRHYAVNVRASWLLIAAFARQLPSTGGAVIALTSDHTVGNLPYGATKGALDRLVLAAAHELAERKLRANVINPGPVDTGWMDDETRASAIAMQPSGGSVDQWSAALQQWRISQRSAAGLGCFGFRGCPENASLTASIPPKQGLWAPSGMQNQGERDHRRQWSVGRWSTCSL
jgi:3-oxoacyl-[acyl-carrier protein] reductase